MRLATISLPVPVSPTIRTLLSLSAITRTKSKTARILGLRTTTTESREKPRSSGIGGCAPPDEEVVSNTATTPTATSVPAPKHEPDRAEFRAFHRFFCRPRMGLLTRHTH